MIELRNIKLENVNVMDQLAKVTEEDKEFIYAVLHGTNEEVLEELCDKLQAALGLAERSRGITAKDIMEYWPTHLEKMEHRPR